MSDLPNVPYALPLDQRTLIPRPGCPYGVTLYGGLRKLWLTVFSRGNKAPVI
jgi:hypothetical protein